MLVYRAHRRAFTPADALDRLGGLWRSGRREGWKDSDGIRELLLEAAELETAAVDALCPEEDGTGPLERALREATLQAGRLLCACWDRRPDALGREADRLGGLLGSLAGLALPARLEAGTPEGYAWYALYPESYLEAARRFHREVRPKRAVCIGIRSIGTGLSAAVAAALETLGCRVRSYTVRPRGHPFDRRLRLSAALERELQAQAKEAPPAFFLVADEGPGLSGSSFACAAQRLSELGLPDERIVLFPGWLPDGGRFLSPAARESWGRHRRYAVDFEEAWIRSGRLAASWPARQPLDISAGRWRRLFYRREGDFPAVHPHHERRKYLLADDPWGPPSPEALRRALASPGGPGRAPGLILARFAGLGRYGAAVHERALALARERLAPRPLGLRDGFLLSPFVPGRPAGPRESGRRLLEDAVRYLARLHRAGPAGSGASPLELVEMVRVNVAEGLGERWADRLERRGLLAAAAQAGPPVAVDGRLLLHEWIDTGGGYLKVDGAEHHADHFYPGCQDAAWDVAAAGVELAPDRAGREYLAERYAALSGDRALARRLPFYQAAYLAFRLGYAALAAQSLAGEADGRRFARLARRYAAMLREQIRGAEGG